MMLLRPPPLEDDADDEATQAPDATQAEEDVADARAEEALGDDDGPYGRYDQEMTQVMPPAGLDDDVAEDVSEPRVTEPAADDRAALDQPLQDVLGGGEPEAVGETTQVIAAPNDDGDEADDTDSRQRRCRARRSDVRGARLRHTQTSRRRRVGPRAAMSKKQQHRSCPQRRARTTMVATLRQRPWTKWMKRWRSWRCKSPTAARRSPTSECRMSP